MPLPRIAIVGGGPAGLCLGRILQVNQILVTIFELEASRTARSQGGIVDVHGDSGQLALKGAGLFEQFQKNIMQGADVLKIMWADGRVAWDENNANGHPKDSKTNERNKPEIDRGVLREMLLDSIEPNSVHWGKKLVEVKQVDGGKYDLHFTNGVERGYDLVIGADGAWSRVRPLLTDVKPVYSGATLMHLIAYDTTTAHPWLDSFAGKGSMFMRDENRMVVTQRNAGDRCTVYGVVKQPEDWVRTCGIDWDGDRKRALREFADRYFSEESGCHEDFRRVLAEEALDELIPRPLYMLPVGHEWEHRRGVTLVGDAAHLKTPFAGLGVNDALADVLELSTAIVKRKEEMEREGETELGAVLSRAVVEYEKGMFVRAKEKAQVTQKAMISSFGKNGTRESLDREGVVVDEASMKGH